MMSSDHEILLDIQGSIYRLNTRLERVEAVQGKQGQDIADLKAGLQETNTRLGKVENSVEKLALTVQHLDERLSARIADLHTFFYYGLVIIGVLAALGTFFAAIFALGRKEKPEKSLTRYDVIEILKEHDLLPVRKA